MIMCKNETLLEKSCSEYPTQIDKYFVKRIYVRTEFIHEQK